MRTFIDWNCKASAAFDMRLSSDYRLDGNRDFIETFAPKWLRPRQRIVDIGAGKNPFLPAERKAALGAHVTGLDISAEELSRAPAAAYDEVICADICSAAGEGDADLCICQALLEHVPDVQAALVSIASFLKPGGVALVFVPSRNAVFARLNLLLPERLKRFVLFTVYPHAQRDQGFRSYYNRCTPADFREMAREAGFEIVEQRLYFTSAYFTFFAPLHVAWRLWLLLFRQVARAQAAETFSIALRKVAPS